MAQLKLECMLNLSLTIGNSGVKVPQRKPWIKEEHKKTYITQKNLLRSQQTGEEAEKLQKEQLTVKRS